MHVSLPDFYSAEWERFSRLRVKSKEGAFGTEFVDDDNIEEVRVVISREHVRKDTGDLFSVDFDIEAPFMIGNALRDLLPKLREEGADINLLDEVFRAMKA